MIDSFSENFKMRLSDFCRHTTNMLSVKTHTPVVISDEPEKLQLQLTELQYDSILRSSFKQEA